MSEQLVQATVVASSGYPPGLYILFFTEMWERFSYYGMRAILVLYMIKQLHFSQADSSAVYGTYTSLVYLTPFFGGLLADRVIGYKKAILIGAGLMTVGHFAPAIPGLPTLPAFYAGLALLIFGNGAFKPNISTVVGRLYREGDPRRDAGFTFFYMGINLGAFFSPLVCGTLAERYGYEYGFAAAGFGMVIATITFTLGSRVYLKDVNMEPTNKLTLFAYFKLILNLFTFGLIPALREDSATAAAPLTREERGKIAALLIIAFFVVFFWTAFEQAGNTLTLWADSNTVRNVMLPIKGAFEIPASWFQSVNPLIVITFAPVMSAVWLFLSRRKAEPSTPLKMTLGLVFLALGFVVMVAATITAGSDNGAVSSWWLVWAYFFHTVGELCLSPIGLSLVTKLAPARYAAMLMGVWFLSTTIGNKLAGMLGGLWGVMPHRAFFALFVVTSLTAAAALFACLKPLKKLMAGAA